MVDRKRIRFGSALVEDRWLEDVVITIADGVITSIEPSTSDSDEPCELVKGVALPGIANLHSHAFQRGFAGLSEYRTSENDSFWTWRKLMYEFVWRLDPSDVYVVAKQLYLEMLRAGYTWVGEFHYVHNDKTGLPYDNLSEMADAVTNAARDVGIGICLLPTLYLRGGFYRELQQDQQRFALQPDSFLDLLRDCQSNYGNDPNFQIGMALHSLRAVDKSTAQLVLADFQNVFQDRPIHIHVSEQVGEVEECLAATGQRPIEFLFNNFDVDANWCLIHATHADQAELQRIVSAQAVVGLCPSTEANLGDGVFPAAEFVQLQGRFGIGSDSHVAINPAAEMRLVEYGQRLTLRKRAVLGTAIESVGRRLYRESASGGAAALGLNSGTISVGKRADLIVVDATHPSIAGAEKDRLLDRLVFCDHGSPINQTIVGGKSLNAVEGIERHHPEFQRVMSKLLT